MLTVGENRLDGFETASKGYFAPFIDGYPELEGVLTARVPPDALGRVFSTDALHTFVVGGEGQLNLQAFHTLHASLHFGGVLVDLWLDDLDHDARPEMIAVVHHSEVGGEMVVFWATGGHTYWRTQLWGDVVPFSTYERLYFVRDRPGLAATLGGCCGSDSVAVVDLALRGEARTVRLERDGPICLDHTGSLRPGVTAPAGRDRRVSLGALVDVLRRMARDALNRAL